MAFQSDTDAIGNGVDELVVTFAPPFGGTPDFVIAIVQNLVDSPALAIQAQASAVSSTGFTADFNATTDSANYELSWIAGDTALVFAAITKLGTRITDLPTPSRELKPQDSIAVVQNDSTNEVLFMDFESAFMLKNATPPTASTDAGRVSQIAYDSTGAYLYTGTSWIRLGSVGHPTDWSIDAVLSTKPAQGGTVALSNTDVDVDVVYDNAFPSDGSAPVVTFSLETTDVSPTAIYGFITATSLTGFTVTFSTAIDTVNWQFSWHAIQY